MRVPGSPPRRLRTLAIAAAALLTAVVSLASPAAAASDTFAIHNNYAQGRCIAISGGFAVDLTCSSRADDQIWHWGAPNADGWQQLINNNGQCLAVQNGSTAYGASIKAGTCYGPSNPDQYWGYLSDPAEPLYIANYKASFDPSHDGLWVICVKDGSTANGAALRLGPATGNPDQFWHF
ncbi:RICIN domain-containing protein [Rugosimonospora africana]|uniref:Ricin B lectin domain-containing protein n=1 Tax=Rugosimonospora africana TaxID=556532 RepID=A0A8J3QU63_9ACTN|nr:RICIN domain-containing protein [Rugosimonospora africana]GIH16893.1 hypothetical protein Raf01_50650 [Rugosimonospora africana]